MSSDAPITGGTTITLSDQIHLARARPQFKVILAVSVLFGLAAFNFFQSFTPIALLVSAFSALCFLGLFVGMIALSHRRLSTQQRLVTYEVDPERIVIRDAAGTAVAFPWSVVRKLVERHTGFAISLNPAGVLWLAKRAFAPPGIEQIRALARDKLGRAARVK